MRGSDARGGIAPTEQLPLTRRELAFIAAFWTLYAFLTVANRVFGVGWAGARFDLASGPVLIAVVESLCWALLTPLLFWITGRASSEGRSPAGQLLLFTALGALIAGGLAELGTALREIAFKPPLGMRRLPPPFWFGFMNALGLYLGVVAAGLARAYSLRYRARQAQTAHLQARLAQARLDALRRQLDPHFLFNTLNAIASMVERDPKVVRRMIARLSELLRFSLEGADAPEIPLRQELVLLRHYLDIMQVRFQNRLQVEIDAETRALDLLVPTLILQPLAENAITHGVERLTDTGRIDIEARLEGTELVLRVRDNGPVETSPCMSTPAVGEEPARRSGIGLRNTVARLEQLHGTAGRFRLVPQAGGGMIAEVRVPQRVALTTPAPMEAMSHAH